MSRVCSKDSSEVFDDDRSLCPKHLCALVEVADREPASEQGPKGTSDAPHVPGPETPQGQAWGLDVCWHCGQPAAPGNTRCTNETCGRGLTPPALRITFAGGEIELSEGGRAELGRSGAYHRVFRDCPNVSRAHAVVRVDPDGSAWVEPRLTPNGTFLNDIELQPASSTRLGSGDRIRFARDVEGSITLYQR